MSGYSTTLMAQDCLHLMDQLGWKRNVHVVGMSLSGHSRIRLPFRACFYAPGSASLAAKECVDSLCEPAAGIAVKIASIDPERVGSLFMMAYTRRGWYIILNCMAHPIEFMKVGVHFPFTSLQFDCFSSRCLPYVFDASASQIDAHLASCLSVCLSCKMMSGNRRLDAVSSAMV